MALLSAFSSHAVSAKTASLSAAQISRLQSYAEQAVGGKRACIVAIDPRSGRILALANEDMACRKAYPPGSIIKPLTAYAGLESGSAARELTIECRNALRVDGKALKCSLAGGHGKVGIEKAIAKSCNIFFYKLGQLVGEQRLLACFRDFGLGRGCGGIPGQTAGSIPSHLRSRSEIARASIGQSANLRVTALQMAVIASAIANGGTEYVPTMDLGGKAVVLRRLGARPGTFELLRKSMRMAVTEGTASRAVVAGLAVCGKTGSPSTEQNPDYRHAWFIGFAPYDRPEIAVAVFSEWGHGGAEAAPIARKVFAAWKRVRGD